MSPAVSIRVLRPGDEAALEAFLLPRADSSMFLRSNWRKGGLLDAGGIFQGTYAAAFDGARVAAVAAHCWNGSVLLQAPERLAEVVRAAVAGSGREVKGLVGPWAQVEAARAVLGLAGAPAKLDSRETLYAVALADLVVPPALAEGRVRCRRPRESELDLLGAWRAAYDVETLGATPGREVEDTARREITAIAGRGDGWVLEAGGAPVAFTALNARLPDIVQVGGVYTRPPHRGRGYARCAVAGQLLDVRAEGAARAILFTGDHNTPARRAYESLGFRAVGDYGLVMWGRS